MIILASINMFGAAINTFFALSNYPEEIRAFNAALAVLCFGAALIMLKVDG